MDDSTLLSYTVRLCTPGISAGYVKDVTKTAAVKSKGTDLYEMPLQEGKNYVINYQAIK